MLKEFVLESVRFQQQSCGNLHSRFYADLLECALADCDPDVPFWNLLDAWPGNPLAALLPLRMLGALHDLVLSGRAADLAAHYPRPDVENSGDPESAWTQLNAVIVRERAFIESRLDEEIQTNEVRRCAALLPGFLVINQRAQLPMNLAELGASAGLNLCWDRYHYALGAARWGDETSSLSLDTRWQGPPPPLSRIEVARRRGCDLSPLDIHNEADQRRLQSFVWPDHFERMDLLRRAIDAAAGQQIEIERRSAGDFVDEVLSERRPGEVTVIYHSIMWLYVPEKEREHISEAISAAGNQATVESPLAWLRMEFVDGEKAALWLDYWPDDRSEDHPEHRREKLAHCHYHGTTIEWLSGDLGGGIWV
ncbi:MAG: DUF2332 domain-containing protein [Deltaproteobacteria bacterium]|nr:DUF2332 domain-containing protein [Deltaproteobacteria bacterium]MBW2724885.1 DUF2332 domain-containing protein [Deltaproteobacteria bacterium]